VQNLQLGGRQSKSRYQYTLQSVSPDALNDWADKYLNAMRADPDFRDVTSDSQNKGLQASLRIDRDKANNLRREDCRYPHRAVPGLRRAPGVDHLLDRPPATT
jgi:hypothetical protein